MKASRFNARHRRTAGQWRAPRRRRRLLDGAWRQVNVGSGVGRFDSVWGFTGQELWIAGPDGAVLRTPL